HPTLPSAKSGTFQVFRKVDVHYVRKSAAMTPAVLSSIAAEYRRAGVLFDFGTDRRRARDERALRTHYDTWFNDAKNNPDLKGKNLIEANRAYLEPNDQLQAGTGADAVYAAIAQSWFEVTRPIKVDAIREYCTKKRFSNGVKKAYGAWVSAHSVATDDQYLIPFYNRLSRSKKAKVDRIFER